MSNDFYMVAHSWNRYTLFEQITIGCGLLLAIVGGVVLVQLTGFIVSANTNIPPIIEGLGSGLLAAGLAVLVIDSSSRVRTAFAVVAFFSSQFVVFEATISWVYLLCGVGIAIVGGGVVYTRVWRLGHPLDQFFFNVGSVFLLLAGAALFLRWGLGPASVFHIYSGLLVLWVVVGAVLLTTALVVWDISRPETAS